MKKLAKHAKLELNREIVRSLTGNDISRVIGGSDPALLPQSGDKQCPAPAIAQGG